jgi:hypothetical protein
MHKIIIKFALLPQYRCTGSTYNFVLAPLSCHLARLSFVPFRIFLFLIARARETKETQATERDWKNFLEIFFSCRQKIKKATREVPVGDFWDELRMNDKPMLKIKSPHRASIERMLSKTNDEKREIIHSCTRNSSCCFSLGYLNDADSCMQRTKKGERKEQ